MVRKLAGTGVMAALMLLAGCGGGDEGGDRLATGNAQEQASPKAADKDAPVHRTTGPEAEIVPEGTPPSGPKLTLYVGHYPFDTVDYVRWNDHPAVIEGVNRAVPDEKARRWILSGSGPSTPIAMLDGRVASWACEQHNCGNHQWTVMIDPKSGATRICYLDTGAAAGKARWYDSEGKPEWREGGCPEVES